jgi:3'-5' exoribonuclease
LLHDIAKTRTLTKDMHRTPLGQRVDHDDLTLEALAPQLHWRENHNPQAAISLRHLLTWKMRRSNPSPGLAALELIRAADRISARFAPASSTCDTATLR